MTRATPTPASTVIRVTLAVVGGVGLLTGTIAVFGTTNQAGAVVLLLGGVVFVLAAIAYPSTSTTWFAGWGRRAGTSTVATLLRSPSPQVRLAAAEAVLGPEVHTVRRFTSADLRELALDVLLNRDLVRRLADLLRRAGYNVTAADNAGDTVDAALGDPAANVVVRVDRPAGPLAVPITVSNDAQPDVPRVVSMLAIAAGRFDTRSAVAIFTGQHDGAVPLSSITPVGEIRIFTVFSPRLGDEQSVVVAVAQAIEVAGASPSTGVPAPSVVAVPPPTTNGSTAHDVSERSAEPVGEHSG